MKKEDNSYWISVADLMTGMMVIFLFIAILFITQFSQHRYVQEEIYNTLQAEFEEEIKQEKIELKPDGTVRFNTNADSLAFGVGEHTLTSSMANMLDRFIPKYIEVISDPEFLRYIKEIRIEGHTDDTPPSSSFESSYIYNLKLSSKRAVSVLDYVRNAESYITLPDSTKSRFDFLLTSNGMSFSKALNSDDKLIYKSKNKIIDKDKSRRVEFRVVTSNDELLDKIFNMNGQ